MALVTEDGTGQATAESYISITDASTYHNNRGQDAWDLLSDAVKEESLRKATDYMLQVYRSRWKGIRMEPDQALDWPRSGVYLEVVLNDPNLVDDDIVPTEVERACAVLALKAATETLLPDLTQQKTKVKIGPIETEFDRFSNQNKRFSSIDRMLAPYMERAAGTVMAVRV